MHSVFEETTDAKVEKDLDAILKDCKLEKKYKADSFKIEKELDRKGKPVTKKIENYLTEKHSLKTNYTMMKYKTSLSQVESLKMFKTFEDYSN